MTAATSRQRSPNYPNLSLPDAIARVRRVFDADRQVPLEREVVARHMGYSGLSGASDKTIGSIMQYGLLERVGKGEVRVSQVAMDIFHPETDDERRQALHAAAFAPPLFRALREKFPHGAPSQDAMRSHLVRQGFLDRAIPPVMSAYTETCQYLQQENAWESGGGLHQIVRESFPELEDVADDDEDSPPPPLKKKERQKMQGERTLMKGILSTDADFEVLVSGPVGVKEIDRLIQKLELDKEILAERSNVPGRGDDADE